MEGPNTYDQILKQKLNQLEAPDMDTMWEDMHAILAQKMPEEKKRRRLLAWFFLRNNLFLIILLSITAGCVTWYAINNSPISQPQAGKQILINEKHQLSPATKEQLVENTNTEKGSSVSVASKKSNTPSPFSNNIGDELEKDNNLPLKNNTQKARKSTSEPSVNVKRKITANSRIIFNIESSTSVITATAATVRNILFTDNSTKLTYTQATISSEEVGKVHEIGIKKINEYVATLVEMKNDFPQDKEIISNKVIIHPSALAVKSNSPKKLGPFIAGISINYNIPVSGQEMSTVNSNGRNNTLIDYLPSIHAQYFFGRKWYVQTEFQYSSPQYIHQVNMGSKFTMINPNKKEEETASLNKLYYLSVPISIHYITKPGLSVGTGLQYSYLRSSIIHTEVSTWEKSNNSWSKTNTNRQIHVKSNPGREKKKNGSNPTTTLTQVDTLAQNLHSSDWRILVDLNYRRKNITTGVRFNAGLNNYINVRTGGANTTIRDKNQALQLYIRYDLFRSDRKRKM